MERGGGRVLGQVHALPSLRVHEPERAVQRLLVVLNVRSVSTQRCHCSGAGVPVGRRRAPSRASRGPVKDWQAAGGGALARGPALLVAVGVADRGASSARGPRGPRACDARHDARAQVAAPPSPSHDDQPRQRGRNAGHAALRLGRAGGRAAHELAAQLDAVTEAPHAEARAVAAAAHEPSRVASGRSIRFE